MCIRDRLSAELGAPIDPNFEVIALHSERGELFESQWPLLQKCGERLPILLSVSRVALPPNGAYLAILVDVSARKQEALRLQRSDCLLYTSRCV